MNDSVDELVKYDLYKRPNGLLYRVLLHNPLHVTAECYSKYSQLWLPSIRTVGRVISSDNSTLVARNVVFKD